MKQQKRAELCLPFPLQIQLFGQLFSTLTLTFGVMKFMGTISIFVTSFFFFLNMAEIGQEVIRMGLTITQCLLNKASYKY